MFEDRKFIIFSTSELDKVDFNHVLETSKDTVRKSLDGTKTFVKWDGVNPDFVSTLSTVQGIYTYSEILTILDGTDWSKPFLS